MDKSLQLRTGLARSRSVLTRDERIVKLKEADRWQDGRSPLGLPKVRVIKLAMKKKKKKEEGEAGAAAEATKKEATKKEAPKKDAGKKDAPKKDAGKK